MVLMVGGILFLQKTINQNHEKTEILRNACSVLSFVKNDVFQKCDRHSYILSRVHDTINASVTLKGGHR